MGTNFYWILGDDHIGKRSAAGTYCWDCGTTFRINGTAHIHDSIGLLQNLDNPSGPFWHEKCPGCGNTKLETDLRTNLTTTAAGVELGFAKANDVINTGVGSCFSFTWTYLKHKRELKALSIFKGPNKLVVDEYDQTYTAYEFLTEVLAYCPIQFQLPREFS